MATVSAGGHVVEASTGLPLAGVLVRWIVQPAYEPGAAQAGPPVRIGEARTDADGSFSISSSAAPDAVEALCSLLCRPHAANLFRLEGGRGAADFPVETGGSGTVIRVLANEQPSEDQWRALGNYMASNRLIRVDDVARQLSAPSADSPSQAWPLWVRAGGLASAGRALAGNAVHGADEPLVVPMHLLNLDALANGDIVKALTNYRDVGTFERFGGQTSEWAGGLWFQLPRNDLELYRDYLRGVWVGAARPMHGAVAPPMPSDSALESQLAARFHQNFRTTDSTPKPVHALLVPILVGVLTAPASREGFGLAPAALPLQGPAVSDAEHVAALIASSGKSAAEWRNRFRIRFDRDIGEQTSPIALNVEALLGLLADTYQSPQEPFAMPLHGVDPGRPLIFPQFLGRAPFFLQYEEWLDRQRRFYPENVFDIRRALPDFFKAWRDVVVAQKTAGHSKVSPFMDFIVDEPDWHASAAWVERLFGITDEIRTALAAADKQLPDDAHRHLDAAVAQIDEARKKAPPRWTRADFVWFNAKGYPPIPRELPAERHVGLKARAALAVTTPVQLAAYEAYFDTRTEPHGFSFDNFPDDLAYDRLESWLARARTLYVNQLDYLQSVLVPYLRAMIQLSRGDHAGATKTLGRITGYEVGVARLPDAAGYLPVDINQLQDLFYQEDALPYTTAVAFDPEIGGYADQTPGVGEWDGTRSPLAPPLMAPFEHRFFKLAQGEAMLEWADELYRNDDASSIRRARELYKGVLFMHGDDPDIAPHFATPGLHPVGLTGGIGNPLVNSQANPARTSQLARAHAGFGQIELGLNAYGFRADMVPILRYRPLKLGADLFAASAKSSQSDFLQYQTRFEQATIEGWQTATMVKKAEAGAEIAAEQIEIAKAGVGKAQEQVAAVKAQIEAKKKEIADSSSFFSQAEDFFGGMKDSLSGLASAGKGVMNDNSAASSTSSEELVAMMGKSSGGASAAKEAMVATLGSGAALTLGFGAFAYYGYTTMQGMADAAAKRSGDLAALQTVALAAAEAQVKLKQRDVTVATYTQQIATAELDLARALDRFQRERFLNVDLWNKLSDFAHRTMRRYIELGARAGWLAERALAFEGDRAIHIIRLNYVPTALKGLTGADRLQLDLAELEANRLDGIRLTVPVKHTLSLARDFPLAFGRLKKTGRCAFHTGEAALRVAYPGTFAYRVRALTVAAHDADGPPPRGVLRNLGASTVSRDDGSAPRLLVRFPDALPLSEFRLQQDLWVYGLPGETLLQFEGSGIETDWELEFPPTANPKGFRTLTDVLLTCDMNATYSQALAAQDAAAPAPVARSFALAASMWDPRGLASLRAKSGPARIEFDLAKVPLPMQESNRVVKNIAVLAVGATPSVFQATLRASSDAVQTAFVITRGVALSNAGPLLGAGPPLALNALVSLPLDQPFVLELDRSGVAEELAVLHDIVLWLEYEARL